jgi:predicted RNA binding protein YcfA (HicA-like mRNA interferase family)
MPKLPLVKPRTLIRFLETSGFFLDHVSGSHFIYRHPVSGKRAVVTQHNRDIRTGTLPSILHQSGFSREDFLKFVTEN